MEYIPSVCIKLIESYLVQFMGGSFTEWPKRDEFENSGNEKWNKNVCVQK